MRRHDIEQVVRHGYSSLLCDDGDEASLRIPPHLAMKLFRIQVAVSSTSRDELFILDGHDNVPLRTIETLP